MHGKEEWIYGIYNILIYLCDTNILLYDQIVVTGDNSMIIDIESHSNVLNLWVQMFQFPHTSSLHFVALFYVQLKKKAPKILTWKIEAGRIIDIRHF